MRAAILNDSNIVTSVIVADETFLNANYSGKWVNVDSNPDVFSNHEYKPTSGSEAASFTNPIDVALSSSYLESGLTEEEYTQAEIEWRNSELVATDHIENLSGSHSHYEDYMTFRQELRDWPEHANFPDSRHRPIPAHHRDLYWQHITASIADGTIRLNNNI